MGFRRLLIVALVAALGIATSASADSILVSFNGVTNLGGGVYQYSYTLSLDQLNQVHQNDGVVVFDFDGYIANSYSATWKFAAGNTFNFSYGNGPTTIAPTTTETVALIAAGGGLGDNPFVGDLILTYSGGDAGWVSNTPTQTTQGMADSPNVVPGVDTVLGQLILGTFTVNSTLKDPRTDSYYAQDHNVSNSTLDQNQGQVLVAGQPGGMEPGPLPSAAWGGMGLLGILFGSRSLRSRRRTA
jgi:hypothetical protein